jgi:hypothetical protein
MRVPRVRFTVRRMMVAVAVVALLLAWMQAEKRIGELRDSYYWQMAIHAGLEELETEGGVIRGFSGGPTVVKPNARRAAYHAAMRRKYKRAYRYPWLPIAPDPPIPE